MSRMEWIETRIGKMVEIANTDPTGRKLAHKLGSGKILVRVGQEKDIPIEVRDGLLTIVEDAAHPKAVCEFSDADTAWALLTRKLSPFAATVHRQLNQYGLSPMNETFEKIWLLAHDHLDGAGEE